MTAPTSVASLVLLGALLLPVSIILMPLTVPLVVTVKVVDGVGP